MMASEREKITVRLQRRGGKFIANWQIPTDLPVDDFKAMFYQQFHYYPERQWWNVDNEKGPVLKEGTLREAGVKDNAALIFKDLGVQISWRLVFVLEYSGPIFFFCLFYFFPGLVYSLPDGVVPKRQTTQILALWLVVFHFVKREMETLFVHRFSNATMPIIRVPLNCGHYWILLGVAVGYFVFHPQYTSPWRADQPLVPYLLATAMMLFEFLNFQTHLVLRSLRPRGTKARGIPNGWGFQMVSCANYWWETLAWLCFCLLVQCATGWFFLFVAFAQMVDWALKRHRNYRKQFDNYPRNRQAIVPFIL